MTKLSTSDYKLLEVDGREYVFLTGSQEIMEITNPLLIAYFNPTCESEAKGTNEETFDELTSALIVKRDAVHIREDPDRNPRQVMLTLNTTHRCNMACSYCFAFTKYQQAKPMPINIAEKAIRNLLRDFPETEQYMFYFFGGEPLLCKDLIRDTVSIVEQTFRDYPSKKFGFLLNTNGILLNDSELLQFFKDKGFTITVSIDGPEEINDSCRMLNSGEGSFRHIMAGIRVLQRYEVKFNLRATISPRTKNLLGIFQFFENLAFPYAYAFTINASEKNKQETEITSLQWNHIQEEYRQVFKLLTDKLLRGETVYNMDFNRKLAIVKQRMVRTHSCEAGRANFFIDEQGDYYACQNMLPYHQNIGNLEDGICLEKQEQLKSQFIADLKDCQECWARYLCGGGCQTERISNATSLDIYCKIIRFEWNEAFIAFIRMNRLKDIK